MAFCSIPEASVLAAIQYTGRNNKPHPCCLGRLILHALSTVLRTPYSTCRRQQPNGQDPGVLLWPSMMILRGIPARHSVDTLLDALLDTLINGTPFPVKLLCPMFIGVLTLIPLVLTLPLAIRVIPVSPVSPASPDFITPV